MSSPGLAGTLLPWFWHPPSPPLEAGGTRGGSAAGHRLPVGSPHGGLTPWWDHPTVQSPSPGCGDPTPGEGGVGQCWVSGVRVPHCRPSRLSAQHRHADVIPNQQHRRRGQEQIPSGSLRLCVAVSQIGPRGGLCMRTRRARPRLPAARRELRSSKNKIS